MRPIFSPNLIRWFGSPLQNRVPESRAVSGTASVLALPGHGVPAPTEERSGLNGWRFWVSAPALLLLGAMGRGAPPDSKPLVTNDKILAYNRRKIRAIAISRPLKPIPLHLQAMELLETPLRTFEVSFNEKGRITKVLAPGSHSYLPPNKPEEYLKIVTDLVGSALIWYDPNFKVQTAHQKIAIDWLWEDSATARERFFVRFPWELEVYLPDQQLSENRINAGHWARKLAVVIEENSRKEGRHDVLLTFYRDLEGKPAIGLIEDKMTPRSIDAYVLMTISKAPVRPSEAQFGDRSIDAEFISEPDIPDQHESIHSRVIIEKLLQNFREKLKQLNRQNRQFIMDMEKPSSATVTGEWKSKPVSPRRFRNKLARGAKKSERSVNPLSRIDIRFRYEDTDSRSEPDTLREFSTWETDSYDFVQKDDANVYCYEMPYEEFIVIIGRGEMSQDERLARDHIKIIRYAGAIDRYYIAALADDVTVDGVALMVGERRRLNDGSEIGLSDEIRFIFKPEEPPLP